MSIDVEKFQIRRSEIRDLISKVGVWNINQTQLGEKYGVSHTMIQKDIQEILKDMPKESFDSITAALEPYFKRAIKSSIKLLDSHNESSQAKGVNALISAISQYLSFVGSFQPRPRDEKSEDESQKIVFLQADLYDFINWAKSNDKKEVLEGYELFLKERESRKSTEVKVEEEEFREEDLIDVTPREDEEHVLEEVKENGEGN